jgi:hypothetical protein
LNQTSPSGLSCGSRARRAAEVGTVIGPLDAKAATAAAGPAQKARLAAHRMRRALAIGTASRFGLHNLIR